MQSVFGKTVLVTGAAMGMGKLFAQLAVDEQAAAVVVWDINEAALNATAQELRARGGKVYPYIVDVSKLESIRDAAARVCIDAGNIDILINNAGIVRGKYFWEHDPAGDIWPTMAINALAPMYLTREFIPAMIDSGRECRVLNIVSAAALVSNPRMSVYCASKWSAFGWSDSIRLELRQAGYKHVRVTTVCPGYVSTGMFDGVKAPLMTPILKPEQVVKRAWNAMKAGKPMVMMPWTIRATVVAKGLPLFMWDFIADKVFGVYHTMETFKGHPNP